MTTTTVGKSVPAAVNLFNVVEMDTPEATTVGTTFPITLRISADPSSPVYATWQFFRDGGTATFKIELFADTIGPGTDLALTPVHDETINAGQDDYTITLDRSFPLTADKVLYEIAAVITMLAGGVSVGNSAFVGDAVMQVS